MRTRLVRRCGLPVQWTVSASVNLSGRRPDAEIRIACDERDGRRAERLRLELNSKEHEGEQDVDSSAHQVVRGEVYTAETFFKGKLSVGSLIVMVVDCGVFRAGFGLGLFSWRAVLKN